MGWLGKRKQTTTLFQHNDELVMVLGQTGAGKSSFINHAMGSKVASVGGDLNSHTQEIKPYFMSSKGSSRIVLVDTPGFDDTHRSDREIMVKILEWLRAQCMLPSSPVIKFAGIIYLHEISQARANTNTELMNPMKLSRPEISRHVILVTTKWKEIKQTVGLERERNLSNQWQLMKKAGAHMARFNESTQSALDIIDMLKVAPVGVERLEKELNSILNLLPADSEGFISRFFGKIFR